MFCAGKRTRLAFIIFAVKRGGFGVGLHPDIPEPEKAVIGQVFLTFVVCRN